MTTPDPPAWGYIIIGLVGIVQLLASVLVGILISKVSGLTNKIDDVVTNETCLERKKVICNKLREHKESNKAEFNELWKGLYNHGHANGKVTRTAY